MEIVEVESCYNVVANKLKICERDEEAEAEDIWLATKVKCGEIFFSEKNVVSFSCSFCGEESRQLEKFLCHMLQHDFTHINSTSIEAGNITEETGNDQFESAYDPLCDVQQLNENTWKIEAVEDHNTLEAIDNVIDFKVEIQPMTSEDGTSASQLTTPAQNNSRLAIGGATFKCEFCSKTFRSTKKLKVHHKRHTLGRTFECEFCDATFYESSNLKVHRNRHLGIKPHSCPLCEKSFTSSSELKLHMRSHTGERPYVCGECGQSFTNSAHLTAHQRRHRNERLYICAICDKGFYDNKMLRDHEAMHSDARPYNCPHCDSAFPRVKALKEHLKLHSGIKKYVCKFCSKSFAQNAGLYSHMKKQHPIK